ncbi:MAG: hypothetical protein CMK59_15040 [Proteobacteria bacterium]|nr:hypothetical protein [Pseudomonadota bacterium]
MLQPKLPDYTYKEWKQADFRTQIKMVCQSWAKDGYGAPLGIYIFYILKILLFIGGWWFFCTQNPSFSTDNDFHLWWSHPEAITKAILWAMLFEGLGLGCGSGPLTARYLPPFGGLLYFLRPGTLKLPLFPNVPVIGHHKRGIIDIGLYFLLEANLLYALFSTTISNTQLIWTIMLLLAVGILDKTLFLAHRSEHYLSALICILCVGDSIAGLKMVWIFLWLGAGISKLNQHFPSVIGVMISNAPWSRIGPIRQWMYRSYPDDLSPSKWAHLGAAMGTALELGVPLIFLFATGGPLTTLGLVLMLCLHLFIMSTIPMGVPLEWNIIMIYGACALFGVHSSILPYDISSYWIWSWLFLFHGGCIVIGNLYPNRVSFLLSHRYYAGNWAYSIWLFRKDSAKKIEQRLTLSSKLPEQQLNHIYPSQTVAFLLSKVIAFRMMHLLGRALRALIPIGVENPSEYQWFDGELICGVTLGWNFGDGHLSGLRLLNNIQKECVFKEGELRYFYVESQPLHKDSCQWIIADAASGILTRGTISIETLKEGQPWMFLKDKTSAQAKVQINRSSFLE